MNKELELKFIRKVEALVQRILWRNMEIIYINSNKKPINDDEIKHATNRYNSQYVKCCSVCAKNRFRSYKRHFILMRLNLYWILKNLKNNHSFFYGGFSSPMFSIYDGFILNDTVNVSLLEYKHEKDRDHFFTLGFSPTKKSSDFKPLICHPNTAEINIIISSSETISKEKILQPELPSIEFTDIMPNNITEKYLEKVYNFVRSALDWTLNTNIKLVHLYVAARQSVSFVIGQAIQVRHPAIRIYEFEGNSYRYYLDLETIKLYEVK